MLRHVTTLICVLLASLAGTAYVCTEGREKIESVRHHALTCEMDSLRPGLSTELELSITGRDARLSGKLPAAQVDLVKSWAASINEGAPERGGDLLRTMNVEKVTVLPPPASFAILRDDNKGGGVTLTGAVPNKQDQSNLLAHVRESLAQGISWQDAITLDPAVDMRPLPPELPSFLRDLWRRTWDAAVRFEGGQWRVTGLAGSEADVKALTTLAEKSGLQGADVSGLRINKAEFPPYLLLKLQNGEKPTIRLRLPHFDPASRSLIAILGSTKLPVDGVVSPQVQSAPWILDAGEFTRHFLRLVQKGEFQITEKKVLLSGETPDVTSRQFLLVEARRRFIGMEIQDSLVIPPPAEMVLRPLAAFEWPPAPQFIPRGVSGIYIHFKEDGSAEVKGTTADERSRAELVKTLRGLLAEGSALNDGLLVANDPKQAAPDLLESLRPFLSRLRQEVRGGSLTWISGHALLRGRMSDKEASNQILALLRQFLPDMILTNQIQIETSQAAPAR